MFSSNKIDTPIDLVAAGFSLRFSIERRLKPAATVLFLYYTNRYHYNDIG